MTDKTKHATTVNNLAVDIAMRYHRHLPEKEVIALAKEIKAAFRIVLQAEYDDLTRQMQTLLSESLHIEHLLRNSAEYGAPESVTTYEEWQQWLRSTDYTKWRGEMVNSLNQKRIAYRDLKAQRAALMSKQKQL